MRIVDFKKWAEAHITPKAARDAVSRCKKIESALQVNLDEEFKRDEGKGILSKLEYSVADENSQKPAPEGFSFKEGSCIRFRMTDLRSAAKRYFKFCSETSVSKCL